MRIFDNKKEYEILSYKNGDWFINCNTVGLNNGLRNQTYKLCINANIKEVKRLLDGKIFTANNTQYSTTHSIIYATHFWMNHGKISVAGYYEEHKNPYSDETISSYYFSPNLCELKDLL